MAAKLLKGAEVAKEIRAELKIEVEQMQAKHGLVVTILG
jgi:methylenetetrahydrofolate dehydrogenase (NADP+)/methenyltetrahydrofolate cyclohydrolase